MFKPRKKIAKKLFSIIKKQTLIKQIKKSFNSTNNSFNPKYRLDFKGEELLKIYEIGKKRGFRTKYLKTFFLSLLAFYFGKKIYNWKKRNFFGKLIYPIFFLLSMMPLLFYFNYLSKYGKTIYLKNCGKKICYNTLLNYRLKEVDIFEQQKYANFGANKMEYDFLPLTDRDNLIIFDCNVDSRHYVLDWDLFKAVLGGKEIVMKNDPNEVFIDI